jgi:HSP20 family protein
MALEKWRPFGSSRDENMPARRSNPMQRFQQEMNRLFEDVFQGSSMMQRREGGQQGGPMTRRGRFTPRIDISEDASQLKVSAELPGMDEGDVEITATRDTMTIQGEKTYESEEQDENFHRTERSYGYFKRTIPMPADADIEGAEATFHNGVLDVRVPKTGEGREQKKLEISGGE